MKKAKLKWTSPVIIITTFDEISQNITAMARSRGPCGTPGACFCSTSCNPTAFYWSCQGFFVGVG